MIKQLAIPVFAAGVLVTVSSASANDCLTAVPVDAANLPIGFVVDVAAMSNAVSVPCANTAENGPETWYRLTGLRPGARYSIETSSVDTIEDTRIAIYADSCASLALIACTDDVPESGFAFIDLQTIEETSVLVLVECADPNAAGGVQISFSRYAPAIPGDGCANPLVMESSALPVTMDVTPSELSNDRDASCGRGPGGPETWVALPGLPDGDYVLETVTVPGSAATDTRLELFANPNCEVLSPVACNDDINESQGNRLSSIRFHSAGESFLALVEANTFEANRTVRLRLRGAPALGNEDCGNAVDLASLPLPISSSQNLAGALDLSQGPCNAGDGSVDQWYELPSLSSSSRYSLRTNTIVGLGNDVSTSIAVYRGACGAGELVACDNGDGGHAQVEFAGGAAAPFFALVEASPVGGSLLQFNLILEEAGALSPATNTNCLSAIVVGAAAGLPYSHTAELRGAAEAEAWYSFTPTAEGVYSFDSSSTGLGQYTQLRILQGGCAAGLVDVCDSPYIAPAPVAFPFLQSGVTYFVSISAPPGEDPLQTSAITIDGPAAATPASNATCTSPTRVTSFPFNDSQPISGPGFVNLATDPGGVTCRGELYYRVTPTADGTVVVSAQAADGAPAVIAVLDGCTELNVLNHSIGDLRFPATASVPLLVAIEPSVAAAADVIAVSITQESASANDACADATPIVTLPYSGAGDFAAANDEGDNSPCSDATERRDLFWSFTPTATGRYRVIARSEDNEADTAIAVLTSTCGTTPTMCIDETEGGESGILVLTGGTPYIIAVEGPPADASCECPPISFSLAAVPASSGADSCATAQDLGPEDLPFTESIDTAGNSAAGTFLPGPSQFYRFTADAMGTLQVTTTPQSPGMDLALGIAFGSCSPSRDTQGIGVASVTDSGAVGAAETSLQFLFPGDTVTIIVESHGDAGGSLSTDIQFIEMGDGWLTF